MATTFEGTTPIELECSAVMRGGMRDGILRWVGEPAIGIGATQESQEAGISIYGEMRAAGGGRTNIRIDIDARDFPLLIAAMKAANPEAFKEALKKAEK